MTALKEYQRLEAIGLWRASEEAQKREVVLRLGEATLVIADMQDRALSHWSIPAIRRANPEGFPAIFHPDADPGESIELGEEDREMIEALNRLAKHLERRPASRRGRRIFTLGMLALGLGIAIGWLPGEIRENAAAAILLPQEQEFGRRLTAQLVPFTGPACETTEARAALDRLARRVRTNEPPRLIVVPSLNRMALSLPGGRIILNRKLAEDYDLPDVMAGYILAELAKSEEHSPLANMLDAMDLFSISELMATGILRDEALATYAEQILDEADAAPEQAKLIDAFTAAKISPIPYARSVDASGETVLPLLEAGVISEGASNVLPEQDWLWLQTICEE